MSYLVTLAVAGPTPFLSFMALAVLIITLQAIPITPGSLLFPLPKHPTPRSAATAGTLITPEIRETLS